MQYLSLAPYLLCTFFFSQHSAESVCEINGESYNVGEIWKDVDLHTDCIQYECLPDGTITSSKCDPAQGTVDITPDNISESEKLNPTTELEPENQNNVEGCIVDGHIVNVGEQVAVEQKCLYRECAGNEHWIMKLCPAIGLSPGWILTPEDVSKPYPECCGRGAPLLDIIPDVISSLQWSVSLRISYGNNTVDYGNNLLPSQVEAEPRVEFLAEQNSWFLLAMVQPHMHTPRDRDANSEEFLHWLVGNIPENYVSSGDVLVEYFGTGNSLGPGLHRFVFLLYKQPRNITFQEPILESTSINGRNNFSLGEFSKTYNLSEPISLNYFITKLDTSD